MIEKQYKLVDFLDTKEINACFYCPIKDYCNVVVKREDKDVPINMYNVIKECLISDNVIPEETKETK